MKALAAAGALLLTGLLSACSILPAGEALNVYLLPSNLPVRAADVQSVDWSLRVNRPQSSQLLDSPRIAVLPEGDLISAYQGARWSDRAPALVRDRLIGALLDDRRISAVSSDDSRLQADLELSSDLRAFQSEYRNGRPEVHILLDARLVQAGNQRILASRRFEVRQIAGDPAVESVVKAFGEANDQLSRQLMDWVVDEGQRNAPDTDKP
ncbi:ABC-type transport auxiliary lipoprotein family protein [Phytopseudomonas seleniipraecipitans]|jgi:cholesterol transport system auxiliary component|uniref:Cholesterol transport system auxiliary component n=1 Tax=Phytopseudomonas seleniipraecipitans TaxID=640205 RepID=A0A1G7S5Y4_9GAMM|nr:ABC-type transport auxiliary lipoprotein family protein [Pseudomonas seleniipraecipitans]SDG17590.1 cholesterol transport system auxiliary component [Pseudomonas seleniipraecipitans]